MLPKQAAWEATKLTGVVLMFVLSAAIFLAGLYVMFSAVGALVSFILVCAGIIGAVWLITYTRARRNL